VGPRRDPRAPQTLPAPPPPHAGSEVCCPYRKGSPREGGPLRQISACQNFQVAALDPFLDRNSLYLVERDFIPPPVVQLRRPGAIHDWRYAAPLPACHCS
jgi:hypothetical protein